MTLTKFTTILMVFLSSISFAQPLQNGMAILTHWTGASGQWDAFSIFDTENNMSAPLGQNWATTFNTPADPAIQAQWKGTNMGDVFGVAIDDQKNAYFTTTKVISSSGSTTTNSGVAGDGGVYKLNANDWSITPLITTGTGANQIPNQNVGLGNICFDKWNNQLFITNFEDGKIYRFDTNGNLLSTFDPFDPDNGTPGFAGHGEAIWGINVYADGPNNVKVYFSQWTEDNSLATSTNINNSVWSVDLDASGEFSGIEDLCFSLPDISNFITSTVTGGSYPISDITFSADGKMYVCEKQQGGWSTFGGFDNLFTPGAHNSRLMEFTNSGGNWTISQQYGVGNYNTPYTANNTAGGVALSNRQTVDGIDCEKLIWATGDALRFSGFNPADGGQTYVYGAAGIPVEGNSIDPTSPDYVQNTSIYIDVNYTGMGNDGSQKMSFGDMDIYSDQQASTSLSIIPDSTICPGGSITLNVSGGSNYQWTPAASLVNPNSSNPIASPNQNTTYTVSGDGACGGVSEASITVSIDDFSFTLGPDLAVCNGSTDPLILDGGNQAIACLWSTGEVTPTISINTPGTYSLINTSPNFCNYSDEILVTEGETPTLGFSTPDSLGCNPSYFSLLDSSLSMINDPISSWSWTVNGQNYSGQSPNIYLDQAGTFDVSLEVITQMGCIETLVIDDYFKVNETPDVNFTIYPEVISNCDKTILILDATTNYDSIVWNLGDGTIISQDTLFDYTFENVNPYQISLEVYDENGCRNSVSTVLKPLESIPFFAPNAFTPNSDTQNDVFRPVLGCSSDFSLSIINRWGETIFRSSDPNVGWDGTYQGRVCPTGVYAWRASYNGIKIRQVKMGEVHLMN
ncbi:MAG: gliding motility-associated C-terminal domain-containing protein [Flavobacteriales bacterium]